MVEKAYNHKPLYLIAKENGEIKGVLPLFLMKSIIFEKKNWFRFHSHRMVVFVQTAKLLKTHL